MGYLTERVSYLRGLVDGIAMDKDTPESRIFDEIIELLDDMASSIEGVDEKQEELEGEISATQDDVNAVWEDIDGIWETVVGDEDEDDSEDEDDGEDEDDAEAYYDELECPNCGEILPIDEDLLDSEEEITLTCPGCGEQVVITLEDAEEDDWDDLDDEDAPFECTGNCESCPGADRE